MDGRRDSCRTCRSMNRSINVPKPCAFFAPRHSPRLRQTFRNAHHRHPFVACNCFQVTRHGTWQQQRPTLLRWCGWESKHGGRQGVLEMLQLRIVIALVSLFVCRVIRRSTLLHSRNCFSPPRFAIFEFCGKFWKCSKRYFDDLWTF